MIALALLLAALAPEESLADQVAACGVDRAQIRVEQDAHLQAEIATIATPDAALTEDLLGCLVDLAVTGYFIEFADPMVTARFTPQVNATSRRVAVHAARLWLANRGLLQKLPFYDPEAQTLPQFTQALEAMCGIAPGTRLKPLGAHTVTFVGLDKSGDDPALQCLFNAVVAADTDPEIVQFGITGNEAVRD